MTWIDLVIAGDLISYTSGGVKRTGRVIKSAPDWLEVERLEDAEHELIQRAAVISIDDAVERSGR